MFERTDEALHVVKALHEALSETGLRDPNVEFQIQFDGLCGLYISAGSGEDRHYKFARSVSEAWAFIRSIGTSEERKRKLFLQKFSELLQAGRDAGVDLSGLTPVFDEYRNNLLTHEAAE